MQSYLVYKANLKEGDEQFMILASAIKFHILETDEEVILCGSRHGDIFKQLKYLGFEPREGYVEEAEGFIDQHNKFYTREEALEHAHQ